MAGGAVPSAGRDLGAGRSVRIVDEARCRLEGFIVAAARPWRRSGPHRRPDLGIADRGTLYHAAGPFMKNVTILGSTGSIGVSTLDVIARHPDRFRVFALPAASRIEELAQQCRKFTPRYAVIPDAARAEQLRARLGVLGVSTEVMAGAESLETIAAHPQTQTVMAAIVGAAGLRASLAAARAGKTVLLANKEALVMAGQLFMDAAHEGQKTGGALLPIDSEHTAVFQSLPLGLPERIEAGVFALDLARAGKLEFETLDRARFPCVQLAYDALRRGGTAPAVLNAANEVAVAAFLAQELDFLGIPTVIDDVLSR